MRDEYGAGRRALLEAICQIDRITQGSELSRVAQWPQDNIAGMYADAHLQRRPEALPQGLTQARLHF